MALLFLTKYDEKSVVPVSEGEHFCCDSSYKFLIHRLAMNGKNKKI